MPSTVLIIDDEPLVAESIRAVLSGDGYHCLVLHDTPEALELLESTRVDLIVSDIRLPHFSGIELVTMLKKELPQIPIILTTGYTGTEVAIEAMKAGAYDFLEKPFDRETLLGLVRKALHGHHSAAEPVAMGSEPVGAAKRSMIGTSPLMRDMFKQIGVLAATQVTVLIRGETGTGKELVARALHQHSERARQPLLAVNCMAIPAELLESELFGHEKGSFTGAHTRRIGRFEQAREGTLLLDEIGDLPASTQAKLLRVLQERVIQRVGSNADIPVNTRVLAATNRNLEEAVSQSVFRQDLYYRLTAAELRIPPLRERLEDVPALVEFFLRRHGPSLNHPNARMTAEAVALLKKQPWPGNVRELENVVRKAVLESRGLPVTADLIGRCLYTNEHSGRETTVDLSSWMEQRVASGLETGSVNLHKEVIGEAEKILIGRLMEKLGGRKAQIARVLGVSRPTLNQKLKDYGLE